MFHRSLSIVDQTVLDIDFKNDLNLAQITDAQSFNLVVDFVDSETNKTFSATTSFNIEMSDYSISIVHSPQYFKPGLSYSFTVLVTRTNGYPVLNSELPVEVTVKDDKKERLIQGNYSLDLSTGGVEITVSRIPINAEYLTIKAKYDRVKYAQTTYKTSTRQKEFVSINVLTPR